MNRVFVSYRRSDAQGEAGHLLADLRRRFGDDRVFMDIAAIRPGEDFGLAIQRAIQECSVVLVVIGRGWTSASDESGKRRLDDPNDWVRLEIASALASERLVVPVMVQGAAMPTEAELPESIRTLARRNAHEMSARRWDFDFETLSTSLAGALGAAVSPTSDGPRAHKAKPGSASGSRSRIALVSLGVAVAAVGIYWLGFGAPANDARTANKSAAPKMATATFGDPLSPSGDADFRKSPAFIVFDQLNADFAGRPDLSDAELRRLDTRQAEACEGQSIACQQAALQAVRKTLESICLRKLGRSSSNNPSESDAQKLRVEMDFSACLQKLQAPMLDETLNRSRDAVRAIKPG